MAFQIIRNDITRVKADAIVNTANPNPTFAAGTDAAIYEAAGVARLLTARKKIGVIAPGEAVETPAFSLKAKYIIHTVGPIWNGGSSGEEETLRNCYENSLRLAKKLRCKSIAFPLISAGVYGFPKDVALQIAMSVIEDFVAEHSMKVILVVFDKSAFELSGQLVDNVREYVDANYVESAIEAEYDVRYDMQYDRRVSRSIGLCCDFRDDGIRYDEAEAEAEAEACFDEEAEAEACFDEEAGLEEASREADDKSTNTSIDKSTEVEPFGDPIMPVFGAKSMGINPSLMPNVSASMPQSTILQGGIPQNSMQSAAEEEARQNLQATPRSSAKTSSLFGKKSSGRKKVTIDDLLASPDKTFQEKLFEIIDERGLSGPAVYKNYISKQVYSKIQSDRNYHPNKYTALALCLSLHLDVEETLDLIGRAGWTLSPSSRADLVIKGCILNEEYNIVKINCILFDYDCPEFEKIK